MKLGDALFLAAFLVACLVAGAAGLLLLGLPAVALYAVTRPVWVATIPRGEGEGAWGAE